MIALAPLTLIACLVAPASNATASTAPVPIASMSPAPALSKAAPAPPVPSASAQPGAPAATPSAAPPFAACAPLPEITPGPPPFAGVEKLSFDIDVTGAAAATMTMELLPRRGRGQNARQPILVQSSTNTFFAKVRQVKARLVSEIDARTLRAHRLREEIEFNGRAFSQEARFKSDAKLVSTQWQAKGGGSGARDWPTNSDTLDYVGAFYFFRALPLKVGDAFCFDVLAMRRLWRVEGTVKGREHASTPAGEFPTLHLAGKATRHDKPADSRELHLWLSDDARHLPVAAMGVIDLGAIRAILSGVDRPDLKSAPARPTGMEW